MGLVDTLCSESLDKLTAAAAAAAAQARRKCICICASGGSVQSVNGPRRRQFGLKLSVCSPRATSTIGGNFSRGHKSRSATTAHQIKEWRIAAALVQLLPSRHWKKLRRERKRHKITNYSQSFSLQTALHHLFTGTSREGFSASVVFQ